MKSDTDQLTINHFLPSSWNTGGFAGAAAGLGAPSVAGVLKGVGPGLYGAGPFRSAGFLCVFMSSGTFFKTGRAISA